MPDSPFTRRVLSVVRRIPAGRVATYGDVAAAAGRPRAARAVGNIMRECKASDVPAHRVIAAAGQIGGYGGNIELKKALLRAEGAQEGLAARRGAARLGQARPRIQAKTVETVGSTPRKRSRCPRATSNGLNVV
jgi:O-6-methylguanine DNA methyltransferase